MISNDIKIRQDRRIDLLRDLANRISSNQQDGVMQKKIDAKFTKSNQFAVHIFWIDVTPLLPERMYSMSIFEVETQIQITDLAYRIEPDTDEHLAAKFLDQGQFAYCKIATNPAIPCLVEPSENEDQVFRIHDPKNKKLVGIGVVDFALRRANNLTWHSTKVTKSLRAKQNNQRPCVLWFTGLSGSGKSTIADIVEQELNLDKYKTYLLDGDNVRHGLCRDLGFTDADRVENIRRVAEVAKLMTDAGLIVIASFISPFASERRMARVLIGAEEFIEIFVDTPLDVCEQRDPKGLYQKARSGILKNFTGIDSIYERPSNAELVLRSEPSPKALAAEVLEYLKLKGFTEEL